MYTITLKNHKSTFVNDIETNAISIDLYCRGYEVYQTGEYTISCRDKDLTLILIYLGDKVTSYSKSSHKDYNEAS